MFRWMESISTSPGFYAASLLSAFERCFTDVGGAKSRCVRVLHLTGLCLEWWANEFFYMGVSKNNDYKPSILGYPYFWKHPYRWPFSLLNEEQRGCNWLGAIRTCQLDGWDFWNSRNFCPSFNPVVRIFGFTVKGRMTIPQYKEFGPWTYKQLMFIDATPVCCCDDS